ncbi:hypothetical protein SAY86_024044 [Trapa natans]|uniref:Pentatricopeptide repeat-containing protein n=1 Tax=Trapa natans TaxID=22666 RepID=A0AAN7R6B6_TRANT|nr:hypothetical protein SAY86_024044 [Trapa natans]
MLVYSKLTRSLCRSQGLTASSLRCLSILSGTAHDEPAAPWRKKDDYFAVVHHISNIVRRDFYMERTLNKIHLTLTPDLILRVLRACHRSADESLRFFNWARSSSHHGHYYSPTSIEFEEMVKILASAKKPDSVSKILDQMKNSHLSISPDTLCSILESYGRLGLVDHAVEIFNRCKSFNCEQTVEVYNSLLFALCEIKMFHGAYALIRRMIRKGVSPNKRTYSVLVNGWCSAGKMREAQEFLEEMSRKGYNPPVRGRDLLIEGLLNAGYLESAKEMVRKMTKEGVVPDVETFNSLLEAISKSGEIESCADIFHTACKLGLSPNINTYKILIPAVSKDGPIEEAISLLHNCIDDGHKPFPSLYAPIIKGMFRKGQFDDAFCFFSDMKIRGHPPNRPVYTMLITMCGRGGRYVEAANYLVEMTEFGMVPISRCFDMIVDGLKNCGKHDLAKKIEQLEVSLREIRAKLLEPEIPAHCLLIGHCSSLLDLPPLAPLFDLQRSFLLQPVFKVEPIAGKMAFRGGRGRGRFGGGQRSYAKEEPFVLYPEIELPSISKISSNDNRNFIMWKSKFESFCKASPYYLGDGTSKYDPFANLDPERYSDKEKPKNKQSLPEFLQPTVAHFPKDILEDSKWKLTKKGKKMQLDADTDLKRFDIFEKLEQKQEVR